MPDDGAEWVEPLCRIAETWRASGESILHAFQEAALDLSDVRRLRLLVGEFLSLHPALVNPWQEYSYDKHTSSGSREAHREAAVSQPRFLHTSRVAAALFIV